MHEQTHLVRCFQALCSWNETYSHKFPVFDIITWFTVYCTTRFIKLSSVGQLIFSGFTPILLKQIIGKEFKCWPIYKAVWNFVRVLFVINHRPPKDDEWTIFTVGGMTYYQFSYRIFLANLAWKYTFWLTKRCDVWRYFLTQSLNRSNHGLITVYKRSVLIRRLGTILPLHGIDIIHQPCIMTPKSKSHLQLTKSFLSNYSACGVPN